MNRTLSDLTKPFPLSYLNQGVALAVFAVAYAFAYRYGMSFSQVSAAPFWFPDSVMLCVLLFTRPSVWVLFVAAALPIRLFSNVSAGIPAWFLGLTFVLDAAKNVLTAAVLHRVVGRPVRIEQLRDFAAFCLFAVLVFPGLTAFGGAAARAALGSPYWPAWQQWFLGDAVTHLVVTPALIYWVFRRSDAASAQQRPSAAEAALLTVGLIVTGYVAFSAPGGSPEFAEPLFYLPVPFLFWAAIRFGMTGATGAVSLVAIFTIHAALTGRGPFGGQSAAATALSLQSFLLLRAVPIYIVAILVEHQRAIDTRNAAVLRAMPDMTFLMTRDGRYLDVHAPDPTLLLVRREEIIGRRIRDILPPHLAAIFEDRLSRLMPGDSPEVVEYMLPLPSGESTFEARLTLSREDEVLAVVRDVTLLRQAEAALRQAGERYAMATVAGSVGVWDWDLDTKAVFVDPFLKGLLGYEEHEIANHYDAWVAIVHPDDMVAVEKLVADHFAGLIPFIEIELRMRHRDGSTRWFLVRGSALQDGSGRRHLVGTDTDITERKATERALHDARAELARSARLAALGEFAASIAHEIRQPLTAIVSNADAYLRRIRSGTIDTASASEILHDILRSARRADDIVQRDGDLFRRKTVAKTPLNINSVVREATELSQVRLDARGVSVAATLASNLPPVHGDRVELVQVLVNLIGNGIDAMDDVAQESRRLEVATSVIGDAMVQVSVTDCGVGLDAVDVAQMFALFYTTKKQGTGVGLAISRAIIQAHGGRLWAEANPGPGARVAFALPIYPLASIPAAQLSGGKKPGFLDPRGNPVS